MNDKISWFGRYLGCEYVMPLNTINWHKKGDIKKVTPHNLDFLNTISHALYLNNTKLILKELKDISDEDLKELNGTSNCRQWEFDEFSMKENEMLLNSFESDFLRSKGYAIGIDKKYYITESELNK